MLDRSNLKLLSGFAAISALSLSFASALIESAMGQTSSEPTIEPTMTCAYDPNSGRENPLGMRAFITAIEQDGNTTFRFDQFPSPIGNGAPATIASRRELTFYGVGIEPARTLLLDNPSYYSELVGYSDNEGFAIVNEVLSCQTSAASSMQSRDMQASNTTVSPISPAAATISSLPDGVYRYWSGPLTSPNSSVSDEELLRSGGTLFLFRKTGSQVVGSFSYIDGEAICVSGQATGNTIAGIAVLYQGSTSNLEDTFTSWGASNALQVRQGQQVGSYNQYNSALLDLNGFNRINAGLRLPPERCR
jgi:hypothetical protein